MAPARHPREREHEGLSLERYARITALLRCPPDDRWKVLAAEDLPAATWDAARSAWSRAIEEEIARGGDELLLAFAEALTAARAANAEAANDRAPIAPEPPVRAPEPAPMLPVIAPPAMAPSPWARATPAALGATGELDLRRVMAKILPFGEGARAVEEVPRLTLEQYASLAAEIAAFPAREQEIRARFRVQSDAAYGALNDGFRALFAANPAVGARWQALVAHYRAWFLGANGAPQARAC